MKKGHEHDDTDLAGLVFFVDPIDGTMNFVKQQAHFAIMIGVYQDGEPVVGAIMDVMRNEVLSGGPNDSRHSCWTTSEGFARLAA